MSIDKPEMSTAQTWVVCEHSSRWAAALRIPMGRSRRTRLEPRLYEVRTLADLMSHLNEHRHVLGLIEVGRANLAQVLPLMADNRSRRLFGLVALLDQSVHPRHSGVSGSLESDKQLVMDALWEAGAAEVMETPRDVARLLALGEKLTAAEGLSTSFSPNEQSLADWAWSTLPWQER